MIFIISQQQCTRGAQRVARCSEAFTPPVPSFREFSAHWLSRLVCFAGESCLGYFVPEHSLKCFVFPLAIQLN